MVQPMPPDSKSALRTAAREKRRTLRACRISRRPSRLTPKTWRCAPGTIVGGYHALPDEADPALLLARLVELGCHVAFPRVAAKDAAAGISSCAGWRGAGARQLRHSMSRWTHWPRADARCAAGAAAGLRRSRPPAGLWRRLLRPHPGALQVPRHRHRLCRAGSRLASARGPMIGPWTWSLPNRACSAAFR